MNICLNMIVKNESARIERALASAAPYITSWVIVDTGSTDDTKEKITAFFKERGIPGEIREEPFIDWSQARNAALHWARELDFVYRPDYILLMDADMQLVVKDEAAFKETRTGANYQMTQRCGPVHYSNARLVSAYARGEYRGVTHEYLDIPSAGDIPEDVAYFIDYADGANRPEKFKRDIRLLKAGLKAEPNNARYMFYLACSYRDAGQRDKAAKWFQRRVDAGGWDEEVWQAQLNLAHCFKGFDDATFVQEMIKAYNMRPTRAETLYDLAHYYRHKKHDQPIAYAFAEAGMHLEPPKDILFVNDYVYDVGLKEEAAICAYYTPGKRARGFELTDELATYGSPHWDATNGARENIFHYIEPLSARCPSFTWRPIDWEPPKDWVAMNPSVCVYKGALHINVRCVNYRMDDVGRYLIRNTETGEVTNDNPINTRNFLLYLGADAMSQTRPWAWECYRDGNMPVEFPLVIGFEDVRLIPCGEQLFASATCRQLHVDGNCEQVVTELVRGEREEGGIRHTGMRRILREPRQTEKNWAPILDDIPVLSFMWRPGVVVNSLGKTVVNHKPPIATDNISGSSQVIPFSNGWLAVTHTAHTLPGQSYLRYYTHRFVQYDDDFRVKRVSLPFCFHDRTIEFCAGACWHPVSGDLVLSYGFQDKEARIATLRRDEVEMMLWTGRRFL